MSGCYNKSTYTKIILLSCSLPACAAVFVVVLVVVTSYTDKAPPTAGRFSRPGSKSVRTMHVKPPPPFDGVGRRRRQRLIDVITYCDYNNNILNYIIQHTRKDYHLYTRPTVACPLRHRRVCVTLRYRIMCCTLVQCNNNIMSCNCAAASESSFNPKK